MFKINNPITYNDVERCPYHYTDIDNYAIWIRNDEIRLDKIRRSILRWLRRMFEYGAWHPSSLNLKLDRRIYQTNQDLWL